jgi:hypothetical protein
MTIHQLPGQMSPAEAMLNAARVEIRRSLGPVHAQASAMTYDLQTIFGMLEILVPGARKELREKLAAYQTERNERWRLLCLPSTVFAQAGENGPPLVMGAIDEGEDRTSVTLLTQQGSPFGSMDLRTFAAADKGEALRAAGRFVEGEIKAMQEAGDGGEDST